MAYSGKQLYELQADLKKLLGCEFFSDRLDFKFDTKDEQEKLLERFSVLKEFFQRTVKDKITLDGIKYIFDDGSTLLVRKSGTEPLLRIYIETQNVSKLEEMRENVKKFVKQ